MSKSLQWPVPDAAAIQDGKAIFSSGFPLIELDEQMDDISGGKPESLDSLLQRWSFWPWLTSMNLLAIKYFRKVYVYKIFGHINE